MVNIFLDIFKCIFLNEKKNRLTLPYGLINNIAALVQIMAWRHSDNKPLYEYMRHMASMS